MTDKSYDNRAIAEANVRELKARYATLRVLCETLIPAYLQPIPSVRTLRAIFSSVPAFKTNPQAKRGGGEVFYHVGAAERALKARVRGGREA